MGRHALDSAELNPAHLLLEAAGATPAPESPGYRGSPNGKTATLARELSVRASAAWAAQHVERAARLDRIVRLLLRCAEEDGWRCGLPVCPRCECRKAKRYRTRQEARLRQGGRFALVTLTLACDDLKPGARALQSFVAALRRRVLWRGAVAGGESHLQVKRAGGNARRWNVHVHALVQLREGARLESRELRAVWTALLGAAGATGSADVRTLTKHWALYQDARNPDVRLFVSRPAFYVTSRKPGRDLPQLPPADLDEVLRFLPKKRRVSSFGCWRKKRPQHVVPPQTERKIA